MQTRGREHGHHEGERDRRTIPLLLFRARHELHLGADRELAIAGEFLHCPHDGRLLGNILGRSGSDVRADLCGVGWHGNLHDDVLSKESGIEDRFDSDLDLDTESAEFADDGTEHSEGRGDILCDAVSHEFKFSVGRRESDGPVAVELAKPNTLMEADIIDGDFTIAICVCLLLLL